MTTLNFKVPILIGITGHRDVRPEQFGVISNLLLKKITDDVLDVFPNSPVNLLTPLADGADRLVAKVALELNIPLIVPLPMRQEIYESTFVGEDGSPQREQSKEEFKALLSKAEDHFILPIDTRHSENDLYADIEARNRQFAIVGAFLAKHCHILIALYDGIDSQNMGGTSQVVTYRLTGDMKGLPLVLPHHPYERIEFVKPDHVFDTQHTGIIWHVKVARMGFMGPPEKVKIEVLPLTGDEKGSNTTSSNRSKLTGNPFQKNATKKNRYEDALYRLNTFNKDLEENTNLLSQNNKLSYHHISKLCEKLHEREEKLIQSECLNSGCLRDIRRLYLASDHLAGVYANDHRSYLVIFIFIVLGVTAAELSYADRLFKLEIPYLFVYVSFLSIGYAVFVQHKWRDVHKKFNEYRALAEALRVQFFWRCAGLISIVPDHYPRKHQLDTIWISNAVKAFTLRSYSPLPREDSAYVMKAWGKDQKEYFASRLGDIDEEVRGRKAVMKMLYCTMFFLALAAIFLHYEQVLHALKAIDFNFNYSEHDQHAFFSLALGFIPVIFLVYETKMNYLADAERNRSYRIYHSLFSNAYKEYRRIMTKDPKEIREEKVRRLIYDLGCEALIENGDWLIINRDKKAETPK